MKECQAVIIEYTDETRTEWWIDYGKKRRIKYAVVDASKLSEEQLEYLRAVEKFTRKEVNVVALPNMSEAKVVSLIERIARAFCGMYAPNRECSLEKKYIRWAIKETLESL